MSTIKINLQNGMSIEGLDEKQAIKILKKLNSPQTKQQNTVNSKTTLVEQENVISKDIQPYREEDDIYLQTKIADLGLKRAEQFFADNNIKQASPLIIPLALSNTGMDRRLTSAQSRLLSSIFYYSPSKTTSKGRAPYAAAVLMDQQIYTLPQLKSISNAPTSTIAFAIERLKEAGCTVEMSSLNLTKNTLIQLTAIAKPSNKLYAGKAKSPTAATLKPRKAFSRTKNSPVVIPKKFTNLTV